MVPEEQNNLQPIAQFTENEKAEVLVSEASECKSSPLDDSVENIDEEPNVALATELEGNEEPRDQHNLEPIAQLMENKKAEVTDSEASECKSSMLDDSIENFEEEPNLEFAAELDSNKEAQDLVPEEQNNLEAVVHYTESEKSQDLVLKASECNSSLVVGINNFKEGPNMELTAKLEGGMETEDMVLEATECKFPEYEVGKLIPGRQTWLESPTNVKGSLECETSVAESTAEVEEKAVKENLIVVPGNIDDATDQGIEAAKLASVQPKTELANEPILDENKDSCPISQVEDIISLPDVLKGSVEGCQTATLLNGSSENADNLPSPDDCIRPQIEVGVEPVENLLPFSVKDAKLGTEVKNGIVEVDESICEGPCLEDSCPTFEVENSVSLTNVLNELVEERQTTTEFYSSSDNVENLPSPADCIRPQMEVGGETVENPLPFPAKDAKLDTEVWNDSVEGDKSFHGAATLEDSCPTSHVEDSISPTNALNESVEDRQTANVLNSSSDNTENLPFPTDCIGLQIEVGGEPAENLHPFSVKDANLETEVMNGIVEVDKSICGEITSEAGVGLRPIDAEVNGADGNNCDSIVCQQIQDKKLGQMDEFSAFLKEGSSADALKGRGVIVDAVKRPFHFLVKIPRYDDDKLREQIRRAQEQVEEKTGYRDAVRLKIQTIREKKQQLHERYEASKSEERAARDLVKLKRHEIDSVQSVINRVKNAIAVEDIDIRMQNMEHMMQHETLNLRQEKQFIREIKQLKHLREQLSSNMGSLEEVQQAMHQRDHIEDRLRILKKELDCLKDKVSKAEAVAEAAAKEYYGESKKLNECHSQFRSADGVRQKAYADLQNLKRQFYEKNSQFRRYKEDVAAANDYGLVGDKEALHRICVNQVETIMALWNKNDEFREEYVRCNTRSTVRRFRTLDGRALGPDEEPPVLSNVVDESINRSLSTPGAADSEFLISDVQQEKQAASVKVEETDGKSIAKDAVQMDETAKTEKPGNPILDNGLVDVPGKVKTGEILQEEYKQTKEEQELGIREEKLRKEEEEAKLKEQRRLEEKAKAKEALERKKKNAEKAQIRAELRAQKDAEQKEKEKEKKARKKERKKSSTAEAPDGNNERDTLTTSESPAESLAVIAKETEVKESSKTTMKRPPKTSQFTKQSKTKSIPPALRNKSKKRMQQWLWIILTAVAILAIFMLGNIGFYSHLGRTLRTRSPGF